MTSSRRWRTGLAILATLLMLGFILWPKAWLPLREDGPRLVPHMDKAIHFGLFAITGLCWMFAGGRRFSAAVLAGGLALALGTEWLQGLPAINRDPDLLDALADLLGAAAAVGVYRAGFVARSARTRTLSQARETAEARA